MRFNVLRFIHFRKSNSTDLSEQPSTSIVRTEMNEMDKTTNLINLNDDCFTEIFEYLNIVDLTSVSTTNKRFNGLACSVLPKKFSRYRIEMSGTCISAWDGDRNVTCKQHNIHRPDVQAYLYYFGHSIRTLCIQFDDFITPELIRRNLLKCCCNNLTELKLIGMKKSVFSAAETTFPNIEKLSFYACRLPFSSFEQVFKCFPALSHLEFIKCTTDNTQNDLTLIDRSSFANLQHLKMFDTTFRLKTTDLRSFENLKSLSIDAMPLNTKPTAIFQTIGQFLPNLNFLELNNLANITFKAPQPRKLKLTKLVISQEVEKYGDFMGLGNLMQTHFEQLEDFEMKTAIFDDAWLDFILRMKTLKRLNIQILSRKSCGPFDYADIKGDTFMELIDLPNLEEITLKQGGVSLSLDIVKKFISKCESLKRFTIVYYSWNKQRRKKCEKMDFGAMWSVREDYMAIVIEKYLN